jgi:glycosyltransferase involved in cell wall biosynthesis
MSPARAGRRIVLFDPGSVVPYYIDSLCRGLDDLGARARVVSSPPLFEPVESDGTYDVDQRFFPVLRGVARDLLRRRRTLRSVLESLAYPLGLIRTWRALRDGEAGVFHLQWSRAPRLDGLLVRALKARGWRIVLTEHEPPPFHARREQFLRQRGLLRMCDAVIVHTAHQYEELASVAPELTQRIHVIAHGGTRAPVPDAMGRARCRERIGVDPERPLILFLGLIKPHKGLEFLVAAMPRVLESHPDALLLVAGEPMMPLDLLDLQIEALELANHVSLRLGFVPSAEVSAYLHAADLLVAPYVHVGASGVVAMAHGHGLPTVVTSVGGLPEFVEPEDAWLVVPPRSKDAIGEVICAALADREELARVGERARRRLARENDWADVAGRTLALYEASGIATASRATAEPSSRVVTR